MYRNMGNRIPHKIRDGIIRELAKYKTRFACVREIGCNTLDQHEYEQAKHKLKILNIRVDKLRKTIEFEDYATGILNIDEFVAVGNATTDKSSGKKVGCSIGEKHIGKLSCIHASETGEVEFYSNNGEIGYELHMNLEGWESFGQSLPFKYMDKIKL